MTNRKSRPSLLNVLSQVVLTQTTVLSGTGLREVPELPYVNFYCSDWLGDSKVRLMPLEARALHIDLLCHSWNLGPIPGDKDALAQLLGVPKRKLDSLWPKIAPCWEPAGEGAYVNKRLEKERIKQQKKRGNRPKDDSDE